MKNLILFVSIFISINLFSQTKPVNVNHSNNVSNNTQDTTIYDVYKSSGEFADKMDSWSTEEVEWFKKTFVHKRGHVNRPTEPIVDFKSKN